MGFGIEMRLRKFVKDYRSRYHYRFDHQIINDYCSFAKLSPRLVAQNINRYKLLTRKDWEDCEPGKEWDEKTKKYYAISQNYVYDLLANNYSLKWIEKKLNFFNPDILHMIRNHPGKLFLEFGGGTGAFCELITRTTDKEVTYLDIPGHVFDFATWRFKKDNLSIKQVVSNPTKLTLAKSYDIIYTDAVFEHLVNPEQVLRELISHLQPGGLFVFLVDLEGHTEELPMHRDIDIVALHKIIDKESDLKNIFGLNAYASVWKR